MRRSKLIRITILLCVSLLVLIGLILMFTKNMSNFEECVAAGNPVMESYPRKCTDSISGKMFTEIVDDYWRFDNINLMQHESDKTFGCFGCSIKYDGNGMCVDPIKEMERVEESGERYCDSDFKVIEKSEAINCQKAREVFDDAVVRSNLPIIENDDSLCHGLYVSSDFSALEPLWGVGTLTAVDENKLTFEGYSQSVSIMVAADIDISEYQTGENYEVDMYNLCREIFMLVDSRFQSPILETFTKPEQVRCT